MVPFDTKPQNFQFQVPLIISVITGAVVLVIALLVFIVRADFRTAHELTEVKVGYLSQLVGERTKATMLHTEAVLTEVHDIVTILDPGMTGTRSDAVDDHLQKLLEQNPYFRALSVISHKGEPVYHSGTSAPPAPANHPPDIQRHLQSVKSGFFIGTSVKSGADGQWVLPVSLPSRAPDGDVKRIVVAVIDLALFVKEFESLTLSPSDAIVLLTEDHQIVMRIPNIDGLTGHHINIPAFIEAKPSCYSRTDITTHTVVSPFDKSERLVVCRKVPDYNLLALASIDRAGIHQSMEIKLALTVIGSLLVMAAGFLAARRLVRNHGDLARQRQKMEKLANTDMLTGLPNRFHFLGRARQTLALAIRYNDDMSCFLLDIDHFKRINDQFGHDAGDQAICKIGEVIENVIRDCDLACRFGGEEFAVLLPRTDIDGALSLMERLLAELRADHFPIRG